jgi:hypothetical protein
MSPSVVARPTFAVTALAVAVALVIQVTVAADATDGAFDSAPSRALNVFAFFTVLSNIIVGVTSLLLALDRARPTAAFRAFRLAGVLCIAVTGVVYHIALADLQELDGEALVADQLAHAFVPVVAVVAWLAFGPRGLVGRDDVVRAALVPVAWLAFTLARGAAIDWYPYPFLDVTDHGYARVLVNVVIVTALFLGLAVGARALARRLADRSPAPAAPA